MKGGKGGKCQLSPSNNTGYTALSLLFDIADSYRARVSRGQVLYMYVVRVVLGRAYVARQPRQLRRPLCTQSGCHSDVCTTHHSLYDSVLGTHRPDATRLLFREFVVYHPDQSYLEYLVEYVRK